MDDRENLTAVQRIVLAAVELTTFTATELSKKADTMPSTTRLALHRLQENWPEAIHEISAGSTPIDQNHIKRYTVNGEFSAVADRYAKTDFPLESATSVGGVMASILDAADQYLSRFERSKEGTWERKQFQAKLEVLLCAEHAADVQEHPYLSTRFKSLELRFKELLQAHESRSGFEPIPDLYVSYESAQKLKIEATDLVSHDLAPRQICDLELLMNGAFNPLKGFLTETDYDSVVENMRLADGSLWPMPITLDVSEKFAESLVIGQDIALRDQEGVILATMTVTDRWTPDKAREAEKVFGADDIAHPAVNYLHHKAGKIYLGGPVTGIQAPVHYDFRARRDSPNELRAYFRKVGWRKVVAFQTRNPLHRAHQELTFRAARAAQANLLIHPVVGLTKPGDVDHFTRVRCYEAVLDKYPAATTTMSLLNLAMRMAGPREAVWHGLIRKNHGCTHFIVGRDHAGPGKNSAGEDFYGPYDAQELFRTHQQEMGIEMVDFKHMVYVQERAQYEPMDEIEDKDKVTILNISDTELRRRLQEGLEIPEWFSFPEVVTELRRTRPPRNQQGFTVFFTGFSGSGKSTIANALMVKLMEMGGRPVTLLDGDIVRKNLSSELGFSKEHRDLNIRRIGYVASEITKNGGIAICAPIAPYATTRRAVREDVEAFGAFVEVHVATTIEECEKRDRKGLYKLAREGKIKKFTGISDPYDVPENPELRVETEGTDVDNCAHQVLLTLEKLGLVGA